ncbi:MAG TPA: YegS/Rv2252/BmrU family lipid kinase [Longimicrobium sp.]|nr:YegS/Rv2252/BmrU family lipid kinase [Longimicrobium sp.]
MTQLTNAAQRAAALSIYTGPRRIRIIVNGKVRNGNTSTYDRLQKYVEGLNPHVREVECCVTEGAGHASELAESATREKFDVIAAAGGDGTLHEVVNGVVAGGGALTTTTGAGPFTPAVALLPLGTANDFATATEISSRSLAQNVEFLAAGRITTIDLPEINGQHFVNMATGGPGTRGTVVPEEVKRTLGPLAYKLKGLWKFVSTGKPKAHLTAPGFEWEGRFSMLAIGNGPLAGGGLALCRNAVPNDGKADLLVMPYAERSMRMVRGSVSTMFRYYATPVRIGARLLRDERPLKHGLVGEYLHIIQGLAIERQVTSLRIESEKPLQLNLDGQPVFSSDFTLRMGTQIRFMLPPSGVVA